MKVKVKCVREGVTIPKYQTAGAAGLDLVACLDAPIHVMPHSWEEIFCGISLEIPEGWQAEIRGRSGLAFHAGLCVLHGVGTIDSDYRGEIGVPLMNHGGTPYVIRDGDRIAQMVFMPAQQVELVEVDELSATARGIRGMGSTGQ
jgi:dUTP pyrophosphatase